MKRYPLGKTGEMISAFGFGCINFGTLIDKENSFALLDQYVEAGGNYLDTANNYSFWYDGATGDESELMVGEWLKERGNRQEIFLSTKVGARPINDSHDFSDISKNFDGLSKKSIITGVEESLKRLQTDYIDLYYAHIDHRAIPLEETLEAFNELVQSGKVRHIGCSNHETWRIAQARQISRANGWAEYCCAQQRFTYLKPKTGSNFGVQVNVDDGLLDYCREQNDFQLFAYTPLLHGYYGDRDQEIMEQYATKDSQARMQALNSVAGELNVNRNQVVLAWILHQNPVILPLITTGSTKHLAENLAALDIQFTKEQLTLLNEATATYPVQKDLTL